MLLKLDMVPKNQKVLQKMNKISINFEFDFRNLYFLSIYYIVISFI